MANSENTIMSLSLRNATRLAYEKILNPERTALIDSISPEYPVLVNLVAGMGTRFGQEPKCIQPVKGIPLARHSIDGFRRFSSSPVICIVGYRYQEVADALGEDNLYVLSDNPKGGTAFAAFEIFSVPGLLEKNPLLIITMGDRIVPPSVFRKLWNKHTSDKEADLTFLTAIYEPPRNNGKGRIVRDEEDKILKIIEEKDIEALADPVLKNSLLNSNEGNCPLYLIRAKTLYHYASRLSNDNQQNQYYLTDLVENISKDGGVIRTITTSVHDADYDLLCSDVTQPIDLALLEGILTTNAGLLLPEEQEIEELAKAIISGRPKGQVESIARQLNELLTLVQKKKLPFNPDKPVGIGISGGRLRIAIMHPDMVRFYGPAWQMPTGAGDSKGEEQIVVLLQESEDHRIYLLPREKQYREYINSIPADDDAMYPGEDISDMITYEKFGTKMSKELLLSLGYFSDEELEERRKKSQPLPPSSLRASNNMRRPFTLVVNAIASLRTLRQGHLANKIQDHLGINKFNGLRIVSTGNIPQGGFSSSSAVTVATKNAINALFELCISPDLLVHLACQAEYGTGVRAGSLDQATEQKGQFGKGTLISSNPRDNYRIMGTYPLPEDRFQIIFPYTVERDRRAWQWSCGFYGENTGEGKLSTMEIRKMTGKAAEIAAILVKLGLDTDFFKEIEADLLSDGLLNLESRKWICSVLLQLPLLVKQEDLRNQVQSRRDWYSLQLRQSEKIDQFDAELKTDITFRTLFEGWRDPVFQRTDSFGNIIVEEGVPLRAIIAYLFAEVCKNFYLFHHTGEWIKYVTLSQQGDCCFSISPESLPSREEMLHDFDWEKDYNGPERLNKWMQKTKAKPFNYNDGLDDRSLSEIPEFHQLKGTNFFRGLALIDLAEAMLKRAFGNDAVAVRVNAAGQGDYFQVHIDKNIANPEEVKEFLRIAFYQRFSLKPEQDFVEVHSGGGAIGLKLSRFDLIPQMIQQLKVLTLKEESIKNVLTTVT
jgi:molybdopterin-guanine dinucleotide biosynthesis protein A